MYADPLIIKLDEVVDKTTPTGEPIPFTLVSINGTSTKRVIPISYAPTVGVDEAAALRAANLQLSISNRESGKGDGATVGAVVKFEAWPVDSMGKKRYVSFHSVFNTPKTIPVSADDNVRTVFSLLIMFARNFWTEERLAQFLDRQV